MRSLGPSCEEKGTMLLINNEEVEKLLDMKTCLEALETGYRDLVKGDAAYRPRVDLWSPCDRPDGYHRWGTMEGSSRSFGTFAIRMKSDIVYWPGGETEKKYCVEPGTFCGLIFLFSIRNGEPLAILNDGILQHMRVGGCGGLGVKYLSRPDSSVVGIIGSGGMARTYLMAFHEVRRLERVKVFSPTRRNREAYAREMSDRLGIAVEPVESAEAAIRDSDIVSSCTDALEPVIDEPAWIRPGTHVTCVRSNEVGPRVVECCDPIVMLGKQTMPVCDEDMVKIHGNVGYIAGQAEEIKHIRHTKVDNYSVKRTSLKDIQSGKAPGRTDPKQISFFINAGTQGLQFASVAGRVYQLAREKGLGRVIPTEWFLQNIRD